jgi:hypothetical protein
MANQTVAETQTKNPTDALRACKPAFDEIRSFKVGTVGLLKAALIPDAEITSRVETLARHIVAKAGDQGKQALVDICVKEDLKLLMAIKGILNVVYEGKNVSVPDLMLSNPKNWPDFRQPNLPLKKSIYQNDVRQGLRPSSIFDQ